MKWYYFLKEPPNTHPPNRLTWDMEISFFQFCAVSPPQLFPSSRRYAQGPPFQYMFFVLCLPQYNSVPLPHWALFWILSKGENLANSSLQDEATDCFVCVLLGPRWIINLAQLVSIKEIVRQTLTFRKYFFLHASYHSLTFYHISYLTSNLANLPDILSSRIPRSYLSYSHLFQSYLP